MAAMAIAASAGLASAATIDWSFSAMLGAIGALFIVLALGRRNGWPDPITVLLAGVVVATICAGGMMLLQHMVPMDVRGRFLTWMMGSVPEVMARSQLLMAAIVLLVGIVCSLSMSHWLNASLLGDDEALSLGVPIGQMRLVLLSLAGIMTAVTVAIAGPIGFVGLISPHLARRMVGPNHQVFSAGIDPRGHHRRGRCRYRQAGHRSGDGSAAHRRNDHPGRWSDLPSTSAT